jgi:hypothetical protein
MALLNQIIAIEKGIKSKAHSNISELYKKVQKPVLFNGFRKSYQPLDENETETLPDERLKVQVTANEAMAEYVSSVSELIGVTSRKDYTNCDARADVEVDGEIIISKAPVSFLLFLEKTLTDLHAFVKALPVLDESENWTLDPNSGLYRTEPIKTHRTKKTAKPIVMYQATPEHPAQTQMVTEDVIAGYWSQVKHSGAISKPAKDKMMDRIDVLHNAIKQAREAANMHEEVPVGDVGVSIFDFVAGG